MEKKATMMSAVVALLALVVGVFVGMNLQGSGLQGKLASSKDTSLRCEDYKSMMYQGTLTDNLGSSEKASAAVDFCNKKFPAFWNAVPTTAECISLKNREIALGSPSALSSFLKNKKISLANIIYCAENHPLLWYGNSLTVNECWAYKSMYDQASLTKYLGKDNAAKVLIDCPKKVFGWAPAIDVEQATCEAYKNYFSQGVLSDMIENGTLDAQVLFSCVTKYPDFWYSNPEPAEIPSSPEVPSN